MIVRQSAREGEPMHSFEFDKIVLPIDTDTRKTQEIGQKSRERRNSIEW